MLSEMQKSSFFVKYPPGSWEHAVASIVNDAHYQLGNKTYIAIVTCNLISLLIYIIIGLFMLTYAIEVQKVIWL
jgi:hypothetical protein